MAAPNSYALESLRFPGYFVEACDVGSLVDRTHGSLRLLRVAPSNDDSDERSGGGAQPQTLGDSANAVSLEAVVRWMQHIAEVRSPDRDVVHTGGSSGCGRYKPRLFDPKHQVQQVADLPCLAVEPVE